MKVLLINGSPHKEGCTYTALSEIAEVLKEKGIDAEIFHIGLKPIIGCTACGKCRQNAYRCIYDDTVNIAIDKAEQSDGFIFGSPVHYASISGAMTSFMDRMLYTGTGAFKYKPAASIVSARRAGTTAAYDQLNKYIGIAKMIMVPSVYWNMVHGNTPEEVKQDLEGLRIMRCLGYNMAWLLEIINNARQNGIELPYEEPGVFTNFIR